MQIRFSAGGEGTFTRERCEEGAGVEKNKKMRKADLTCIARTRGG